MAQTVEREISWSEAAVAAPIPGPYRSGASLYLSSVIYVVPLVCFSGALLSDIAYVRDPNIQWSNFSSWLLAFGILFLGLAILVSITRFVVSLGRKRFSNDWLSGLFIVATSMAALFDNFIHSHDGWTSVWPVGLLLTGISVLLLMVAMLLKLASLKNIYVLEAK